MCGIVGQVGFGLLPVDMDRLEKATDTLSARGPDASGIWTDGCAGLGHRRLAIIDLSDAGKQPMHSADGRYVTVYNGEIYNFKHIRSLLSPHGGHWQSNSDTEVLLAAYREWGVGCLDKLKGMFSFAIWDKKEKVLFAARDHMGVKPFYYRHQSNCFIFASRPKAILKICPEMGSDVDEQAMRFYLESGYIPAPYSIHKGIRKLPPAHYLMVDAKGIHVSRYWNYDQIEPEKVWEYRSEEDLLDELDELIDKSVQSRMISDTPLGAFLSGGIDSSLVVAMMQKHSTAPVKTFTIGFEETAYDESVHAQAVADYIGTTHFCERMKVTELLALGPNFIQEFDEPFFDSSAFPVMAVSKLARRHVVVALSGDGADELFGGYHYYKIAKNLSSMYSVPETLRSAAAFILGKIPQHRFKLLSNALRQPDALSGFLFSRSINKDFGSVLSRDVLNNTFSWKDYLLRSSFCDGMSVVEKAMRLDASFTLPDDYLQKVDLGSMAFSLEAREPLLDKDLVEWSMRLPLKWKLKNGTNKYLLRKLAYRYIPKRILDRPKQGFCVPIDDWLRGPLKAWAEEKIRERRLFDVLPMDQSKIIDLFELHLIGSRNAHPILWAVLMLLDYFTIWDNT
nr:asparagine synthase (glutamine-hydrolyzing) [uncultured Desulfobacter sp.]